MRMMRLFIGLVCLIGLCAGSAGASRLAAPWNEGQSIQTAIRDHGTIPDHGARATVNDALVAGANYLQAMQADATEDNAGNGVDGGETPNDPDDAGWDWVLTSPPDAFHHSTSPSEDNLYGVTALGLYHAYLATGTPSYFTAMTDVADRLRLAGPGTYRTSSDMIFLMKYDDLPGVGGTLYGDAARAKFDWVIANRGGSPAAFAAHLRDERGASYPNGIIGWDLGSYVVAAAMLNQRYSGAGYDGAASDMAEVLWQDSFNHNPGLFDVVADAGWDASYANVNFWWYSLGISGLIDAFSASGTHMDVIPALVQRITDSTYPSGAVSFSYGRNTNDEDWQSTAYCAMTLGSLNQAAYQAAINSMANWIGSTQDVSGAWKYGNNTHYPEVAGENTSALYLGMTSEIAPVPAATCLTTPGSCNTVAFNITRADAVPARGYSVTFRLSPNLALCSGLGSIQEGGYLHAGGASTTFQVLDHHDGSYTVDCAILGLPCGPTGNGNLFTVDVKRSDGYPDGTGTITTGLTLLRNCSNASIPAGGSWASITIDNTPPTAVATLAAAQVKSLNDADGTTKITLTFGWPFDAAEAKVYRAPYGNYPEYDDAPTAGAIPAVASYPPGSPWVLTAVTASGQTDEPATRDFWYYVVYTRDACGNWSAASNRTGGTLNYYLGDVSDGTPTGVGDNAVGGLDISLLGGHYGATLVMSDPFGYLDVGPTTNYSVDARPTTDNLINFEDLIMFAINYGQVSAPRSVAMQETPPLLQLSWDGMGSGTATARLVLKNNEGSVKGIHAVVSYDPRQLKLLSVTPSALANQEQLFFRNLPDAAGVVVDAAKLGNGLTIPGNGELAVLRFQVLGSGRPALATADLRGVNNEFLNPTGSHALVQGLAGPQTQAPVIDAGVALGAHPNPFTLQTEIRYRLNSETPVSLRIFDASGRLVRTLADGKLSAGEHAAIWDGRTEDGRAVNPGVYFYALQANGIETNRKLILLR